MELLLDIIRLLFELSVRLDKLPLWGSFLLAAFVFYIPISAINGFVNRPFDDEFVIFNEDYPRTSYITATFLTILFALIVFLHAYVGKFSYFFALFHDSGLG
jgi:hypothetical protein